RIPAEPARTPAMQGAPLEMTIVRVFNFAAGPATMPLEVLEQARAELTDWQGSGMSVMELRQRGKAFIALAEEAESLLRELMGIPSSYRVLFLQGGATGQFAAIPMRSEGRRVGRVGR